MRAFLFAFALLFCSTSFATVWKIDQVLQGTDGGFGFSSLHDSSGANVMSGNKLADVTGGSGTYNDGTGEVDFALTLGNGDTMTLTGTLLFGVDGFLGAASLLDYSGLANLLASDGIPESGQIGFMPGDVCCSDGVHDPNSFAPASAGSALNFMSLWGSDGFTLATGLYDADPKLGFDVRLEMSVVPVPAAAWLFGTALVGLLGLHRRRSAA